MCRMQAKKTNGQGNDGCWVVTQNTFINVVDTLASAKDTYSLLRKVRSDSYLCGHGMQERALRLNSLANFEDLSEADTSLDMQTPHESESDTSSEVLESARKDCAPPHTAPKLDEGYASVLGSVQAGPYGMPLAVLGSPEQALMACMESCVQGHGSMWLPLGFSCASMLPHADQHAQQREACDFNAGFSGSQSHGSDDGRTTVMLRNLPNNYTRSMLLQMLESEGFGSLCNFVYLPIDFRTQAALGYAFVNVVSPEVVPHFWSVFDGFTNWAIPSRKVCYVSWCEPNQGLEAHIDRYRSSPVMHGSVPDEYKPVLLQNGCRIPFPKPTKAIRAPRVRHGH